MAAVLELLIKGTDAGASAVMKGVGKESDGLSSKLGALIAVAGGVVAGLASFKTLSSAVDKTQEMGSAVSRLTRETGMSAEESSRMLFAFRRLGLGADDASRNLGIFAKQLAGVEDFETGVSKGGKKVADSLREIGIRAVDAAGNVRPISQLLPELADQFKNMPAGVDKTALSMQLFGRSGKDMIPLLNLGAAGLEEMGKKADELGLTLTGKNVEDIKKYTGAQREMGEAVGGLKLIIGLALMPVLTELAKFFVDAQPTIRGFIDDGIGALKGAIDDISKNQSFLAFIGGMRDAFTDLRDLAVDMKEKIPDALNTISEAVGKIPGIDKLTDLFDKTKEAGENEEKMRGLGDGFTKAAAGIIAFSVAAGTLEATSGAMLNSIGVFAAVVEAIAVSTLAAVVPIVLVAAAVVGLAAGAYLLEKKTQFFSKQVLPVLKDIATWVKTKVVPALEEFANTELIPRLKDFAEWLKSDFLPVVKHAAQVFRDDWWPVIKQVATAVGNFLYPALDTLHDLWVGAIVPTLQGAVIPALKALEDVVSKIVDWFSRHESATKTLVAVLAGLAIGILLLNAPWLLVIGTILVVLAKWDEISKMFTVTIPHAIDSVIKKVQEIPILGAIFTDTMNTIWTIVTTYWELIKVVFNLALDTISNTFKLWKAIFSGDWGAAWNAIKDQAKAIWDALSGVFGIALDAIKSMVDSKFEMLKSIGSTIGNAIADALKGIVIGAINWVIDRINEFIGKVNSIDLPFGLGGPPNIGMIGNIGGGGGATGGRGGMMDYHQGGIVPGPLSKAQLAVVHGGERILTPPQQRSWGGGITVVIQPGAFVWSPALSTASPAEGEKVLSWLLEGIRGRLR